MNRHLSDRQEQRIQILMRFAQIGTVIELFRSGLLPEKDWLELQAWDRDRDVHSVVATSQWPRWHEFGVMDEPEVEARPEPFKKRPIRQGLRMRVFERDGFRCVDCGAQKDLTVDHVIPEIHNGAHEMHNFCTRCKSCNSKKGSKMPQVTV